MSRSRSRLAADWFARLRLNATTQEVEHEDVVDVETDLATTESVLNTTISTQVDTLENTVNNTVATQITSLQNQVDAISVTPSDVSDQSNTSTGYFDVPVGTTAQRPSSPNTGMLRYNTTLGFMEQYTAEGWQGIAPPPSATAVSPSSYGGDSGTTFTITGSNFDTGASVKFITSGGSEYSAGTVVRVNSTTITATTPQNFSVADEPLSLKIINGSGLSTSLEQAIDCGGAPAWNTASGSLGLVVAGQSFSSSISATDPDGQTVTYSKISGALPSGISLSSNGSISGTENGSDTYSSGGILKTFTARATDGINTSTRSFSITKKWRDGSSSSVAASSAQAIRNLGVTTDGTYWINVNGTPTELYCIMSLNGGGWMSFASIKSSGGMFNGNSGSSNWAGKNYSYGTYSKTGAISSSSSYWRNYSQQSVSYIMFMTGNRTYWMSFPLNQITTNRVSSGSTGYNTSGNLPGNNNPNGNYYIMHRSGNGEDPWINAGNGHATGNNLMFWGESNHSGHTGFKNGNGGVLALVR